MRISIYPGSIKFEHGALCAVCYLLVKKDSFQILAVFELGKASRTQCDPPLHLRLNKSDSLQLSDISEMVFNPTLFDRPTGKYGERSSCGTHLLTNPPDLLTCFLRREENYFSRQHDPILNSVSATDRHIGRLSILPKRNHVLEKLYQKN